MTLKDTIVADASVVFLNTSEFAELVTYNPHQYFGEAVRPSREISAVVMRRKTQVLRENGDVSIAHLEVHVANSDTLGISSDAIDVGADTITLPPRDGKTAETHTIIQMEEHDLGMLQLQCQ